jgi:succinate dehydrogenase / fumarate reductase cytochrome b subunit
VAKQKSDFGTLYKGHEGQWTWIAHRVTGLAIILFLFAHVVDTAVVGWGPEAYNRVLSVYQSWGVRLLEH